MEEREQRRNEFRNWQLEEVISLANKRVRGGSSATAGAGNNEAWQKAVEIYGIDIGSEPLVVKREAYGATFERFATNYPDIYAVVGFESSGGEKTVVTKGLIKLGPAANRAFRESLKQDKLS